MHPLTAEQRYRQARQKAWLIANRNYRLWMRGEIPYLPEVDERKYIVAEMDRLVQAIKEMGQ